MFTLDFDVPSKTLFFKISFKHLLLIKGVTEMVTPLNSSLKFYLDCIYVISPERFLNL